MQRTAEQLANLINYEKLGQIRLLSPPKVEKEEITTFIACPSYDKAKVKVGQTMERYDSKVTDLKQRLADSSANIESLKRARSSADPGQGFFVDKTSAESVNRYNARLRETQRLGDKINDAVDKHNDVVEKHDEAIREAQEKLAELNTQALLAIDDDIVAAMDKCTKIVEKLSGSENSEDLMTAVEICLMELRIYHFFEDHIEGNSARKDCRERIAAVHRLLPALTANEHVRNYLADLFRRNTYLVQNNAKTLEQVIKALGAVDSGELQRATESVTKALSEAFNTSFAYEGVIDPAELDQIVVKIRQTIAALERNIARSTEASNATKELAEASVNAHQGADVLHASMKGAVEGMRGDLLSPAHFACEMLEEAVIDEAYPKDLRPSFLALRQHLAGAIEEEHLDALSAPHDDRHSLAKADAAIRQASLLRLQVERDKIGQHINNRTRTIAGAQQDIVNAGEVPQRNADAFRSAISTKYVLSCFPGIGFLFAVSASGKVKEFEAGFRSTNQIYKDLGAWTLQKNAGMTKIGLILGGVIGIITLALFFGLKVSQDVAVDAGVPGALIVLSLITAAVLAGAGKRLRSCGVGSASDVSISAVDEVEQKRIAGGK